MDYENSHENIFGLLIVLESKVENSPILIFKVIFFIGEYKEGTPTFIIDINVLCC